MKGMGIYMCSLWATVSMKGPNSIGTAISTVMTLMQVVQHMGNIIIQNSELCIEF